MPFLSRYNWVSSVREPVANIVRPMPSTAFNKKLNEMNRAGVGILDTNLCVCVCVCVCVFVCVCMCDCVCICCMCVCVCVCMCMCVCCGVCVVWVYVLCVYVHVGVVVHNIRCMWVWAHKSARTSFMVKHFSPTSLQYQCWCLYSDCGNNLLCISNQESKFHRYIVSCCICIPNWNTEELNN